MLSTSYAFRKAISESSRVQVKATLTLADGTVHELTGTDFALGGVSVTEATSTMGGFDVGSAIIGTCDLTLANYDQRWDSADFTGSTVVLYVGVELAGGTEWIRRGTYHVEQPDSYGSTIGLHCLDNLSMLEKPYAGVGTTYPATLRTIVADLCQACGVTTLSATFPNDTYVVSAAPPDDRLTCLDVLGYAAQVAGCFADCDPYGRIRVRWYDTSAFEAEDWLDGGTFDTDTTPYSDGDTADGGGFMTGGDTADGGSFSGHGWITMHAIASLTTSTDDVVVTGVRVRASDQSKADGTAGTQGETALFGQEGYVLEIEGNPFIEYGKAAVVAIIIGTACVGMAFRPLNVTGMGSPAYEAGDPMLVIDSRQRTYRTYVTSLTWRAGSYEAMSCNAKTPARNSAGRASAATKAVVQLRRQVKAETDARALAISNLQQQLASSGGLYETDAEQSDHSVIRYYHDKPTLAQSQIVWKFTANAFAFSSDGGETYPYGIDVTGSAILDRIYTIGLNADYVNTGALRIGPAQNPLVVADFDAGTFFLSGAASMGDRTVQQVLDGVDATITNVDVEYAQNQSASTAPSSGWSTTAPAWASGYYIWQRTATTTGTGASAVTTYSTPVMISGRDGTDGQTGPAGADGTGITSIVEQYYLSTSDQTQTGGSWSSTQPTWTSGTYIWTRSEITWDTTPATTTHTTPVLATALTQANSEAKAASNAVTALDNSLNQAEVFNRLTGNGTIQGLYMQNGQLYMNASYIKTGYIGDISGKSYWDLSDGTIVVVNANQNFNNRYEQFKFGSITFTDSSGWLNTRTGQQTANGIMVGDTADSNVSGRSRVYIIPNLPATSSDSNSSTESVIISRDALKIMSEYDGSTTRGCISMNSGYVEINQVNGSTVRPGVLIGSTGTYIDAKRSDYSLNNGNTATTITSAAYFSSTYGIWLYKGAHFDGGFDCQANASVGINDSSKYKRFTVYGSATIWSGLSVYGTKSRVASTDNYSDRLLYSYETPAPLFGDVGSGVIGDDGTCVVSIDDIFQEAARTDMAYQVFLQKCGQGDLWVSEKTPTHFIVEGTAGLAFDWELKAHQTGYETERLEDTARRDDADAMGTEEETNWSDVYSEEFGYIDGIEELYEEAA